MGDGYNRGSSESDEQRSRRWAVRDEGSNAHDAGSAGAEGAASMLPPSLLRDPRLGMWGNAPIRHAAITSAQQTFGNRAVQRSRWNFIRGWPRKISGPSLNSSAEEGPVPAQPSMPAEPVRPAIAPHQVDSGAPERSLWGSIKDGTMKGSDASPEWSKPLIRGWPRNISGPSPNSSAEEGPTPAQAGQPVAPAESVLARWPYTTNWPGTTPSPSMLEEEPTP